MILFHLLRLLIAALPVGATVTIWSGDWRYLWTGVTLTVFSVLLLTCIVAANKEKS